MFALVLTRNTLSDFHNPREERFLSLEDQQVLRSSYEIAELVHNLHASILDAEFVEHDIWFLNTQARSFIKENSDQTCDFYSTFAYYIQELFKLVPAGLRRQLAWNGPEGDYEWARLRHGSE